MFFKQKRSPKTAQTNAPPVDGGGDGVPFYYRWKLRTMGARRSNNAADYIVEYPTGLPLETLFGTGSPVNRQLRMTLQNPPVPVLPGWTLYSPGVSVAGQLNLAALTANLPEGGGYGL